MSDCRNAACGTCDACLEIMARDTAADYPRNICPTCGDPQLGAHHHETAAHHPIDWFTPGIYPSCACGYAPRDNTALVEHWRAQGIEYVDTAGQIVGREIGTRETVAYTDPDRVAGVRADTRAPQYGVPASGYGGKIPTRYWVRYLARWRRVYMMQYGNAGSAYVIMRRQNLFLDTATEHAVMQLP